MKYLVMILSLGLTSSVSAQTDSTDHWRSMGYEARIEGQFDKAIQYYSKIHDLKPDDYDARLALARLYTWNANCSKGMEFYRMMYRNDSTDVEAMNGFAKCHMRWGEMKQAISWARKALGYLPDHVPQYLLLAKAYSLDGQLDRAISVYREAAEIDETYAEIWSGIGKMYYWKGRPKTAIKHYRQALELDPENPELRKEYEVVREELAWNVRGGLHYIREDEEAYEIDAWVQRYGLSKRLGDHLGIDANFILDRSHRNYIDGREDIDRWFDNSWFKLNWFVPKHRISVFGGLSTSDDKITTYGLSWMFRTSWKGLRINNTLTGQYDYFYYWNEVGKTGLEERLHLNYQRFRFQVEWQLGSIDEAPSRTVPSDEFEERNNPYLGYAFSLDYALLSHPELRLGVRHAYLDYEYQSSDYYSPYDRRLTGFMASVYHRGEAFYLYASGSFTPGKEEFRYRGMGQQMRTGTVDVSNWTVGLEMGYDFDPLTLSLGGNRFYNPYYESLTAFFSINWIL